MMVAALLCAGSGTALTQGGSIVMPTREEIRAYQKEAAAGECNRCGIVTSIESLPPQQAARPAPHYAEIPGADAYSGTLQPVPILTRDARAARKEMNAPPTERFRVHVRHDDGSYSSHEIDSRPGFSKGDRVEVTLDGLRPR